MSPILVIAYRSNDNKFMAEENKMLPLIIAIEVAVGGVLYGIDQHNKRKQEKDRFHRRLKQLEAIQRKNEDELATLCSRYQEKHEKSITHANEVKEPNKECLTEESSKINGYSSTIIIFI